MNAWDQYPESYRGEETGRILAAVRAGECVSVVGLSGAGKSNLLGFLARRHPREMRLVDCNRLEGGQPSQVCGLLGEVLEADDAVQTPRGLEPLLERGLNAGGLCLLLDRFDIINDPGLATTASMLRALRDRFKYRLTYVTSTRRPLVPRGELAELFYANTLWLGPLDHADGLWSAGQYAARRGLDWDAHTLENLVRLSWGYPAFLRAACEAHAAGCALESEALSAHPAVRRRVEEFWEDRPSLNDLALSGLAGHPWLRAPLTPERIDPAALTAAEQRLLDFLRGRAGQVCLKDDLIRAVWPEEVVAGGLRDDSLAQLVHRLREKIGVEWVQTVAGRGYRYRG